MAVVLSRVDPPLLRETLAESGRGGWLADAGGGWTIVAASAALGESGDQATYALAAAVRDIDTKRPVLLLWCAEPDSGYLLQRGRDVDSQVWGIADPAAATGDARAATRLLGDPSVEVPWRALLRRTGTTPGVVRELAELIGARPELVAAAAAGVVPADAEVIAAPPPCRARVAATATRTGAVVGTAAGRTWRGLLALAAVFAVVVVTDAVRLGIGAGSVSGGVLALILFSVLAVVCLAVSVGLRRSVR